MRKILGLLLFSLLCTAVNAQTAVSVLRTRKIAQTGVDLYTDTAGDRYKNPWVPYTVIIYVNIPDGTYYQYFLQDTGRIASELVYVSNTLVSYKTYWINDSLQSKCQLTGGKVNGDWVRYDSSGHKYAEYHFVDGMHNELTIYFPNGKIKRHQVEIGRKKGDYLWYIEDYYSNGQLKQKGKTRAHGKYGKWTYCNRDGTECSTKRHWRHEEIGAADWNE